jgi:uncharacterized protein YbgA (DUF1722 family)
MCNFSLGALIKFPTFSSHCLIALQVPEYKKLGELVQADPKLKNRVVIAKVCSVQ